MSGSKDDVWASGAGPSAPLAENAVMPIAIVGISGRFPGDAENPMKLWDMISQGRSALSDIPPDRFNVDAYYHPHNERQGIMNVKKAHFMKRDIKAFDAPFFTLSKAEAIVMDPQQRMALECTYEALENAGIRMEDVNGSNTSCFVGCFTRDYSDLLGADLEDLPLYFGTGTGSAIMSNRISWFFNFKGASVSLDTACSSSMVALHLGCQSLRSGETTLSVVGGTNLMLLPGIMGAMTRLHFLSPDGKCQSFDHRANGYSRGEGAAFCVLKPLHLALRDGDVVRGVIRNTGVNQDGMTPGITLPSSEAQEALIRSVYAEAGLDLADTSYVEAHGTGTPAGDPVEAAALGATFGRARRSRGDEHPLYMGSVKSNVGHLEGGSGLVQVVKAVMMLEKGQIPPSIWFEKPNPRIPMDEWNLRVPTELLAWPREGLRRISINSFGYGGTNAHCVVDDAYHYFKARGIVGNHNVERTGTDALLDSSSSDMLDATSLSDTESTSPISPTSPTSPSSMPASMASSISSLSTPLETMPSTVPKLLVWTSHEQTGLERNAKAYASYLTEQLSQAGVQDTCRKTLLARLARTLATRRSVMPWRSFAVASSCKDAAEQLTTPPAKPVRTSSSSNSNAKAAPRVAFIFTGQGAQWLAMGRELFANRVFRESVEAADRYMADRLGSPWSLVAEVLRQDEALSRLDSADLSQPACTALQVALVDVLRSWGVTPAAVVGHSSGEIAAAYAKGAITREDAWKIAYYRGHWCSRIRELSPALRGSMLAAGIGAEAAAPYMVRLTKGKATVACINSPASVTLSGDVDAIDELEEMLKADGHFARRLRVDLAYHSAHMQTIADKYKKSLGDICTLEDQTGSIHMFSSLTGDKVNNNSELGTEYWVRNIVSPVQFSPALESLVKFSESKTRRRASKKAYIEHLLEIGPHSALQGPIKQILAQETLASSVNAAGVTYQSVLQRGKNAYETALMVAGHLFQYGYPISMSAVNSDEEERGGAFLVDMAPFCWNHSLRYWNETPYARAHRFRKHIRKDLCGGETSEMLPGHPRFRNILRQSEVPWTQFHKVQGSALYPAAGMMIMALEAMRLKADQTRTVRGYELRDIIISRAIVMPHESETEGVEVMLSMQPFRHGSRALAAAWDEFSLFSRKGDDWELSCSGLIRLEYETATNQDFADEEALEAEKYASQYEQTRAACSRGVNPRQFYDHLDTIGLHYGSVFQCLSEVRVGAHRSACRVRIPDTKSIMPRQFEFPHVIHPVVLDGIIQMALPASCDVDEELTQPMVPVSIERLYVSADVPSEPDTILSGYASSKLTGFDEGESVVVVSHEVWDKPLVVFEGIKGKKLSRPTPGNQALNAMLRSKVGTYFHWQQDLLLLRRQQVRDLCARSLYDKNKETAVNRQLLVEIEMACLIIIKRTIQECSPEEAKTFRWNFRLFHEYMQHCLALGKAGKLTYQADTLGVDWLNLDMDAEGELLARVSQGSMDGAALIQHGKHLPQILREELPPLQILMQDNFLHNFYQSGLGTEQHYAQACWYVDMLAHKNPNMRILEIGAGTGGATLPVLTRLGGADGKTTPRFKEYTFTDISSGYFDKARQKLKPWLPFLHFARLNIEEDPAEQGFEEGAYDLIVASNVLHATRSIGKTLENTRKLLKPTGKLVLTEVTPFNKMRFHMIVGSLEGWWYGEDDGRHHGPTLEVDEWNTALIKAGFDGVEMDMQDFPEPRDCGLSVIVSSASAPAALTAPEHVLIVLPASPEADVVSAAKKLGQRLEQRGSEVSVVSLGDTASMNLENWSVISLVDAGKGPGFLLDVSEADWHPLRRLILRSSSVTYVTRGGTVHSENPSANLMSGMARSIRSENYGLSLTTVDADFHAALDDDDHAVTPMLDVFLMACRAGELERPDWEYAIRDGMPIIQRVMLQQGINDMALSWNVAPVPEPAPFKQEGRPLTLGVGTPGRLDTLRFEDDKEAAEPLGADEVEIAVSAAGLNFKDVMVAMGQLAQPALGVDCAGVVSRVGSGVRKSRPDLTPGTRVMTWKLGTFKNLARAPAQIVQRVPDGMDLDTAASIPVVYSTAHYSLTHVARLQAGETLLVHGAAGGVGQAAIVLAQHMGATVLATVSSEAKKTLLTEAYGLPAEHILSSRDETAMAKAVRRLTQGRGVDVVLNSLAGEALRSSWRSIARFGRFVELGQRDMVGNTGLDMAPFLRNVSFHSVNMLDLLDHDLARAGRVFAEVMGLVRAGVAQPARPMTAIPFSRVEEAFRLMQTGRHVGKIVLQARDDDVVSVVPAGAKPVRLRGDATYIIAGGTGGLGRRAAAWMVQAGARNVLLLSRSGASKTATRDLLERLRAGAAAAAAAARIEAWECDVGDETQLLDCLSRLQVESWPPIRGVIQGAMDLRDAIYENMTHEQFRRSTSPKVQGSWHLHAHLPSDLDFFVLLSSSVGIAGSPGQGNYSAGNAYQDALAHHRRGRGLKACSIDLGMVMGVGFLAEETTASRVHDNVKGWSFLGISESEVVAIIEAAVRGESLPGRAVPPQLITGLGTGGVLARSIEKYPWWFHDAKFSYLVQVDTHEAVDQADGVGSATPLSTLLAQVSSVDQAVEIISDALVDKLARSMMVSKDDIETSKPVSSYGVDSLLAVELRTWIHTEIKAEVSVFDLLSNTPMTSLARQLLVSCKVVPADLVVDE